MVSSKLKNTKRLDLEPLVPGLLNLQLHSIFDSISDMIFYLSVESNEKYYYHFINKAFLKGTGLKKEQILNKSKQ